MRAFALTVAVVTATMSPMIAGEDKGAKPITPAEAAKKVNEKCTVEMKVASTGKAGASIFLNSKENFRDKDNFTVLIKKESVESFTKAKIDDIAAHFKDKTILVTGTVELFREHPQIAVEKADQVQLVEKK